MHKEHIKDVITDGNNITILIDDTEYQKQLFGSVQRNLEKYLIKFIELPTIDKEVMLYKIRAMIKELDGTPTNH